MNIKQSIINCAPKQVFITAKQAAALRAQCSDYEWSVFKSDASHAGRGVLCVINKTRVLGSPDTRTSFPGVDEGDKQEISDQSIEANRITQEKQP